MLVRCFSFHLRPSTEAFHAPLNCPIRCAYKAQDIPKMPMPCRTSYLMLEKVLCDPNLYRHRQHQAPTEPTYSLYYFCLLKAQNDWFDVYAVLTTRPFHQLYRGHFWINLIDIYICSVIFKHTNSTNDKIRVFA